MKNKILIIALSLLWLGISAQTPRKKRQQTFNRKKSYITQRTSTTKAQAKKIAPKLTPSSTPQMPTSTQAVENQSSTSPREGTLVPIKDRPIDGYYKNTDISDAKPLSYAPIRPTDVMFSKRIWREIDLRDKMNSTFASPKARLIDVIVDAVQAGELTAYSATSTKEDPSGDKFTIALKPEEAMKKFADSVVVPQFDSAGNQTGVVVKAGEFNPDSILKFRIKEDWIFDKQRSIFEPRIIGIAPLVKITAAGQDLGEQPVFWIYYPEARHIFATKEVANEKNDAVGLSYDDIFINRYFASYIVKESNNANLPIKNLKNGIEQLYESEHIKNSLLNFEQDLWSY